MRCLGIGGRIQPLHAAAGARVCASSSRVECSPSIDTTDEVTLLFGPDADLAVAVQRITREAGSLYPRDGHSDYGHAFVSFLDKY